MRITEIISNSMTEELLQLCKTKLSLPNLPPIEFVDEPTVGGDHSFGVFDGTIKVVSKNRHPIDVMRTLAHEVIHWKQRLNGSKMDGSTGSNTENQANALAGSIMREFGRMHPEYFMQATELDEDWKKAVATGAMALGALGTTNNPQNTEISALQHKRDNIAKIAKEMPNISKTKAEAILQKEAKAVGLKGQELAHFLAQCSHETADFSRMEEYGGQKYITHKYDIKYSPGKAKILGNTAPGDGLKYKGRGFIQLTGKYNYAKAGEHLGLPLLKHPELASKPDIAAKIAIWYWKTRVKPNNDTKDVSKITQKINPSLKGLDSRKLSFDKYNKFV